MAGILYTVANLSLNLTTQTGIHILDDAKCYPFMAYLPSCVVSSQRQFFVFLLFLMWFLVL